VAVEARELKEIRHLSGLSQSEFGRRIRATLGQISVWERGLAPVPAWAEENIAREFGGGEQGQAGAAQKKIPVIGYVSAGETDVHYDDQGYATGGGFDEVERPSKVKDPHAYALRVKGDSMFPAYREGDTLVLDTTKPVYNKDDAVVRVRGKSYFKIFWQIGDEIILRSFNNEHPEIRCKPEDVDLKHKVVVVETK
jgi:phage repressor protein C with HTH and peptisase S24 domain